MPASDEQDANRPNPASAGIEIVTGRLTPAQSRQMATVVAEAFVPKVLPFGVGLDTARAIVADAARQECGYYAVEGLRVVGVLGWRDAECHFLRFGLRVLWRHLPPIKALLGYVALNLDEGVAPEELRIEPLAVSAAMRGKGIGTALMQHALAAARDAGYRIASLDVVDTNSGAERLYRRLGFRRTRTARTGWFTRRAGFQAIHHLRLRIDTPVPTKAKRQR